MTQFQSSSALNANRLLKGEAGITIKQMLSKPSLKKIRDRRHNGWFKENKYNCANSIYILNPVTHTTQYQYDNAGMENAIKIGKTCPCSNLFRNVVQV